MKKLFVAVLLLLVTTSSVFAQALIKKADRIPNREPGYCGWACLATLGRHQKIKSLYNLVDERQKEFTWQWDENTGEWFKSPFVWTDYGGERVKSKNEYVWNWDKQKEKAIKRSFVYKTEDGHTMVYQPRNGGGHYAIANKLRKLGVKFRYQPYENFSTTLIKDSIKQKKACMVVVEVWDEPRPEKKEDISTHAVIVVDYTDKGVEFIDPNDIKHDYFVTHEWFKFYFTGYVLILD